jgi:hypothetical protein
MADKPTKEQRLKELREAAKTAHLEAEREQTLFWKSLRTDVHTAQVEFHQKEHEIFRRMLEEVANPPSYPIWMDVVLTIVTSVIPANHIIGSLAERIVVSKKKLPDLFKPVPARLPRDPRARRAMATVSLKDPEEAVALMRREAKAVVDAQEAAQKALMESRERWISVVRMYAPEAEEDLRNFVEIAAKVPADALLKKMDMRSVTKGATKTKPPPEVQAATPVATVFRWFLKWIDLSSTDDEERLKRLKDKIADTESEEWLKLLPDYLAAQVGDAPETLRRAPPEAFLRFVEACLWCTTYEFNPVFKPQSVVSFGGPEAWGAAVEEAKLERFPFPKDIWDYLVARHYDPYYYDPSSPGYKTYKEIGPISWIAPSGLYYPPGFEASAIIESGRIYTPEERLSMHWGGILAPALWGENKTMAGVLQLYLRE